MVNFQAIFHSVAKPRVSNVSTHEKSGPAKEPAEKVVKDIRRAIRIVLEGLGGEESIAELCRREGIVQNLNYPWSKDFLEAGKKRLPGDTARAATSDEVNNLRREASALKEVVAELTLDDGFSVRRWRFRAFRAWPGSAACRYAVRNSKMPRPGSRRFENGSSFLHDARPTLADRGNHIQHGGADLQQHLPPWRTVFPAV
jgi:transposase